MGHGGDASKARAHSLYIVAYLEGQEYAWLFNVEKNSELKVVQRAWYEWLEFREIQARGQKVKERRIMPEVPKPWQPPEEGTLKLNVSSFAEGNRTKIGLGIVARDYLGRTIQAWAVTRDGSSHPVVPEVEAVRVELLLAQQNGWRKVEIQSDIKAIIECL